MPSSTLADRLAGVDGGLERLEDVLPADHDHRVDPVREQRRDRVAAIRSPSFSSRWISTRWPARGRRRRAGPRARSRSARAQPTSTSAISSGLLHRRLDAVDGRAGRRPPRRSRRCRRARWRARGRRRGDGRRRACVLCRCRRWMMSWVMRSPSCSQLDESRGDAVGLRVVGEQVAQQARPRAARCAPTRRTGRAGGDRASAAGSPSSATRSAATPDRAAVHRFSQRGSHRR